MKKVLRKISFAVLINLTLMLVVVTGQAKAEPYGWSPQTDFSNQGPPQCTDAKPDKAPILLQPNHPKLPKKATKAGEVVLYWHKVPGATGYNIYYGLSPKNYIYTAPDIGDTDNFTIGYLANKNYYFAVQAKKGCAASSISNEWIGRPGKGGYYTAVAKYTPIKKTTAPYVPTSAGTTVVIPTTAPQVQGISTEKQPTTVKNNYQAPKNTVYQPQPTAVVPTQAPKPKGLWQQFLGIFGL